MKRLRPPRIGEFVRIHLSGWNTCGKIRSISGFVVNPELSGWEIGLQENPKNPEQTQTYYVLPEQCELLD